MKSRFFINQSEEEKKLYIDLLKITGAMSHLFSDSNNPFLYYRAMENIFCKAFKADNLSRSDVSADAGKDGLGVGLKTFLQNNGKTFQKIAEFNKESYLLKGLKGIELVKKVSEMRNERIKSTMRICNLSDMIYHLVTRSDKHMAIYEEHMDSIDIEKIEIKEENKNTIHFTDKIHEYSFNMSKSTLLKRFDTSEDKKIFGFNVDILEDPYNFLLSESIKMNMDNEKELLEGIEDYIVLPLYSTRTNKVEKQSGLNQWNAKGRIRNKDEVYISIPSWIHKSKNNFFTYNTEDYKTNSFDVRLPNGNILNMKVAQQGGKALMSNPNSALGNWILRDILALEKDTLVTKEHLDIIGIDSVKLSKTKNGKYNLDFLKSGSFEKLKREKKK